MNRMVCSVLFVIMFYWGIALGQLTIKRDDFVGNTRKAWWQWRSDGPNTPPPEIRNGYVLFSLVDPTADYRPYYDSAFWDGYPPVGGPYLYCTVSMRVKALNPHRYGSRGWGLWYSEPLPNVQQQIWFMESRDDPALTQETWWRAETAVGIDEATHHYVDLNAVAEPVDIETWHTYKIIREPGVVELRVDQASVLNITTDLPDEALAFHIWIDNLIYEYVDVGNIDLHWREWTGKNEILLDYVQVLPFGN